MKPIPLGAQGPFALLIQPEHPAMDGTTPIGAGTHRRAVVDTAEFAERLR